MRPSASWPSGSSNSTPAAFAICRQPSSVLQRARSVSALTVNPASASSVSEPSLGRRIAWIVKTSWTTTRLKRKRKSSSLRNKDRRSCELGRGPPEAKAGHRCSTIHDPRTPMTDSRGATLRRHHRRTIHRLRGSHLRPSACSAAGPSRALECKGQLSRQQTPPRLTPALVRRGGMNINSIPERRLESLVFKGRTFVA